MINYGIAYDFCRISYALIEKNLSILMQVTGTVDTRYIAVLYDMVLHTTHMVSHENGFSVLAVLMFFCPNGVDAHMITGHSESKFRILIDLRVSMNKLRTNATEK